MSQRFGEAADGKPPAQARGLFDRNIEVVVE
jgi:hypothetical protein